MTDDFKFFPAPKPEEDAGFQGRKGESKEVGRSPLARIVTRPSEKKKPAVVDEETFGSGKFRKGQKFREFTLARHIAGGKSKDTWVVQPEEGDLQFLKILDSPRMPDKEKRESNRAAFFREQDIFTMFKNFRTLIINNLGKPAIGGGSLVVPSNIGVTDDGSRLFLVSPFLQNQVLDEKTRRLKRKGDGSERATDLNGADVSKWTEWQRLRFVRSLLLGIWMLHRWGIVHGDIKPTNVLVVNSPDGPLARLIDIDNSYKDGRPFDMTLIGGDEDYFSPERFLYQMDELEDVTSLGSPSDVFSLALMLHRVFSPGSEMPKWSTGKGSASAAEKALMGGEPKFLNLGTGNTKLEALLLRGLDVDPENRPTLPQLITASGMIL